MEGIRAALKQVYIPDTQLQIKFDPDGLCCWNAKENRLDNFVGFKGCSRENGYDLNITKEYHSQEKDEDEKSEGSEVV